MPAPLIPLILFGLRAGATFLAKRAAKKALKRIARKKILTDKSVRKRAKKIGQKATKQEATPPFAKKEFFNDFLDRTFNLKSTPLKEALGEHKSIQASKMATKFYKSRIIKRMLTRKPGQPGKGKPRGRRQKDVTSSDRRLLKRYAERIKTSEDKKQRIINELKKEHKQKKRKRDLEKDSEQRRN